MIEVVWPLPSMVDAVMPQVEQAFLNHILLSDKVLVITAPSPGPYALFTLNAQVIERMKDVKTIFTRLLENRKLLTELTLREQALRPKKRIRYGKPPSKRLMPVVQKSHEVNQQMKLDMESLFIFGNLLLDQWARVISYLVGSNQPEDFDFVKLVNYLQKKTGDKGLLQPLWDNHANDMLWLLYQMRNYRNIFIEHIKEPWQRGTGRQTYGDDFRLGSPSPPGWLREEEIEQAVKKIRYLAPPWTKPPYTDWFDQYPRQLLEVIFFFIDEVKEQENREKIWNVWKKVGGWTFSYDMIAFRLMRFTAESMRTVLDIITIHPTSINVGAAKTSQM